MIDTRIQKLIMRLLARTKDSELNWHEGVAEGEFQVDFPSYSVTLTYAEDRRGGEVVMNIIGPNGTYLEGISEHSIRLEGPPELADQLSELYATARRQALRVDDAIDELLQQVG